MDSRAWDGVLKFLKGMVVRVSQVKLGWRGNKISMASKIAEILLYSKHLYYVS